MLLYHKELSKGRKNSLYSQRLQKQSVTQKRPLSTCSHFVIVICSALAYQRKSGSDVDKAKFKIDFHF